MKKLYIASPVGTSLLTNAIMPTDPAGWHKRMRDLGNAQEDEISAEDIGIAKHLAKRASQTLASGDISAIRKASAELNGIYGIYSKWGSRLGENKTDVHLLIATDTYFGHLSAGLIADYLRECGISDIAIFSPEHLSTKSTSALSKGLGALVAHLKDGIAKYREQKYRIIFNLVGGFKTLLAYMNIAGMLLGVDQICYIFEGEGSPLITIPRLPLTIDHSKLNAVAMALLDVSLSVKTLPAWLVPPDGLYVQYGEGWMLSEWGMAIWSEWKDEALSGNLLKFPGLDYDPEFQKAYKKLAEAKLRIELQESLAQLSARFVEGGITALKNHHGIRYENYTDEKEKVGHIRISEGRRIRCIPKGGKLVLLAFGDHDDVNERG